MKDCWEIIIGIISILFVIGTIVWLCIFLDRIGNGEAKMTWYWWILVIGGITGALYLMVGAPSDLPGQGIR